MAKRKIKNPSTVQICIPLEVYDGLEQLAEFEGSTVSQIGRRAIIGLLVQAGLYRPPQVKTAPQSATAS